MKQTIPFFQGHIQLHVKKRNYGIFFVFAEKQTKLPARLILQTDLTNTTNPCHSRANHSHLSENQQSEPILSTTLLFIIKIQCV